MESQPTYPGAYIQEETSGVQSISGVPTSITAFVGRARRGPIDEPIPLSSFADFELVFGGLWAESALGHSVRDFFQLGGSTAIVVRVHQPAPDDVASMALGTGSSLLTLAAASPGAWGRQLSAVIDNDVTDPADASLFNLTVVDGDTGQMETFGDVSFASRSKRRVDEVLESDSTLVRMSEPMPTTALDGYPESRAATGGNDGEKLSAANITTGAGLRSEQRGLYALDGVDLVNLIVIPPYTASGDVEDEVITDAIGYAADRRAVLIIDPPSAWVSAADAVSGVAAPSFPVSSHAAAYFPRLRHRDPTRDNQLATFAPSGAVAGVIAGTDATKGVWKAPAGIEATLGGVDSLSVSLTDEEIDRLNTLGINCLRVVPAAGPVVWGARTREGDDRLGSEWKYLPVRRLFLFIEESLHRGTQWVVFEPNDETTWSQIRRSAGIFLHHLFRQGAFAGATAWDAYFVKCDAETTTREDIHRGVVNLVVGFAPLKPAEFILLNLQLKAAPPKRRWWRRPTRVPRLRVPFINR